MLKKIQAFFDSQINTEKEEPSSQDQCQLACAALLIEVATVDQNFDPSELQVLKQHLKNTFNLDEEQLETLTNLAQTEADQATSLFEFTQLINQHFDAEEKYNLLISMWAIAFADGNIDKYEEYLIRRVSELIYVAHSDFIRAKISAREQFRPI